MTHQTKALWQNTKALFVVLILQGFVCMVKGKMKEKSTVILNNVKNAVYK